MILELWQCSAWFDLVVVTAMVATAVLLDRYESGLAIADDLIELVPVDNRAELAVGVD